MQRAMLLVALFAAVTAAQSTQVGPAQLVTASDFLMQMFCSGSMGVTVSSITPNDVAGNMTGNPELGNVYRNLAYQYPWAQPSMSMDYLCANMQEFGAERDGAAASGKLIFYGDSTMQCLRFRSDDCAGALDVYKGWWGDQYDSAVWAIGGDTSANLLWRVLNGNQPEPTAKVIVLYVGMMDVQQADQVRASVQHLQNAIPSPQDPDVFPTQMDTIATQITAAAGLLKDMTNKAQILLMGLLPVTGYDSKGKPSYTMNSQIASGLKQINDKLKAYGLAEPRVSYIDCMNSFLTKSGGNTIDSKLYSNTNVPTKEGFKKLAACINKQIDQYMA